MLGLIFGLIAGLIIGPPILPRFLILLGAAFGSSLRPVKDEGVAAMAGDARVEMQGLDETVLEGPSFGVLRAVKRGVAFADAGLSVVILSGSGRCSMLLAAGGKAKSSSMGESSSA